MENEFPELASLSHHGHPVAQLGNLLAILSELQVQAGTSPCGVQCHCEVK